MGIFIEPSDLPGGIFGFFQLLYLLITYGFVLFKGAGLISGGSELLLLVPAFSNIVGSVVLPVLGAVPDGAIILFSGLGPSSQGQLNVGVGALAGSTIMLLTVPWFLSVVAGRVNIDSRTGLCVYKCPHGFSSWSKLMPRNNFSLTGTGVSGSAQLRYGGIFILLTAISYVIIQGPAFAFRDSSEYSRANNEHLFALLGLVSCLFLFCAYLSYQWYIASHDQDELLEETIEEARRVMIMRGEISLLGCMEQELVNSREISTDVYGTTGTVEVFPEKPVDPRATKRLCKLLRPFFDKYDVDRSSTIDKAELSNLLRDLGENISQKELDMHFYNMDTNHDQKIDFQEFVAGVTSIAYGRDNKSDHVGSMQKITTDEVIDVEEEAEEMPPDLRDLSPSEQQFAIKMRALIMMSLGTVLVLVFSDPMVDVFSELANRTGIPAFYVSFVLAPLASNSSELLASYNYALKKTTKTIKISLSTLQGACIMNNTFCLGIFMGLIYFKHLTWEFSAETTSVLFVEICLATLSLKRTITLMDGFVALAVYPLSLVLVAGLESIGWD